MKRYIISLYGKMCKDSETENFTSRIGRKRAEPAEERAEPLAEKADPAEPLAPRTNDRSFLRMTARFVLNDCRLLHLLQWGTWRTFWCGEKFQIAWNLSKMMMGLCLRLGMV